MDTINHLQINFRRFVCLFDATTIQTHKTNFLNAIEKSRREFLNTSNLPLKYTHFFFAFYSIISRFGLEPDPLKHLQSLQFKIQKDRNNIISDDPNFIMFKEAIDKLLPKIVFIISNLEMFV